MVVHNLHHSGRILTYSQILDNAENARLGQNALAYFDKIGKIEERFYNFGLRNHQGLASSHTTTETVTKENFLTGKDKVSIFFKNGLAYSGKATKFVRTKL